MLGASRDVLPSSSSSSSSSQPSQNDENHPSRRRETDDDEFTFSPVTLLIPFSFFMAVSVIAWEDYGASNLWPSRHMISTSTTRPLQQDDNNNYNNNPSSPWRRFGAKTIHGLGFGKEQRLQLLQEDPGSISLLPEIRTYNEVMEEHRLDRVPRWSSSFTTPSSSDETTKQQRQTIKMETAITDLQQILMDVLKLQDQVKDYQWDSVHNVIQSSIIPKLEPAATILRRQLTDRNSLTTSNDLNRYNIGYEEIGFTWGSCAWRHCGALADAEEALDELDHLLGVLEPSECLFCLNIVERSLRDMLAVVPSQYLPLEGIPAYKPYQSVNAPNILDQDQEYLRMLNELRVSESSL